MTDKLAFVNSLYNVGLNNSTFESVQSKLDRKKRQLAKLMRPKNEFEDADMTLWKAYKSGNQQAKWDLLARFEGMIGQYASTHSNVNSKNVVEAQLKQLALEAFDTYSPYEGAKLSTHVMNRFKKLSRLNIKNQQAIRLPENIALKYSKYTEAEAYLTDALGRAPNYTEIGEYLGWGADDVENASKRFHKELVESKLVFDPGVVEQDTAASAFRNAYHSMHPHEQFIIDHTLGEDGPHNKPKKSAQQIMKDLKMTPYQFNKAKNGAIDKIQQAIHIFQRED